jgi:predicted aminopeptidase
MSGKSKDVLMAEGRLAEAIGKKALFDSLRDVWRTTPDVWVGLKQKYLDAEINAAKAEVRLAVHEQAIAEELMGKYLQEKENGS